MDTKTIIKQRERELLIPVLEYIENHLHTSISLQDLSDYAHLSKYHLHRMMHKSLNESLSAYISRLRLERAVLLLQSSPKTTNEIAYEVGYQSTPSFVKAFTKHFGLSPKRFMRAIKLKEQAATENLFGVLSKPYTILQEELHLVYIPIIGQYGSPLLYDKSWELLLSCMQKENLILPSTRFIGISFDDPQIRNKEHCRFYACGSVETKRKSKDGIGSLSIAAGTYAVYCFRGNYTELIKVYNIIFNKEQKRLRRGLFYEEYLNSPETTKAENLLTKIFIPIK